MIRRHRRDSYFWAWWWHSRVSVETKVALALVGVSALGLGGYFAANGMSGTVSRTSTPVEEVREVTVKQLVTIREDAVAAEPTARRTAKASRPPSAVRAETVTVPSRAVPPRTVVRTSERVVT